MLRIEAVQPENQARFIRYAAEHGSEHDDSYLPGSGFEPSAEHPAYLLLREDGVIGAASLMRTPRYLEAGRSRFSIFHSTDPSAQAYSLLFGAIRRHFDGLRSVYLFLPESRAAAADAVRRLGFSVERYSYIMALRDLNPESLTVPEGYALHPIRPTDEHLFRGFARRSTPTSTPWPGTFRCRTMDCANGLRMRPTWRTESRSCCTGTHRLGRCA